MPTTTKTAQSAQFDPGAMAQYQGLQAPLAQMLQGYMQNPFGNPFFQTQQQMGTRQAQNLGQTGMSNISRNMTASGMGGGGSMSPFAMEMLQNQGRANTGLQAQLGFQNPVQNALGMQQFAGGLASNYRPLQTGQQSTQSTGGLGTWLPQLANLGMGLATGFMGGGGLGGGMFGANNFGGGPGGSYGGSMGLPMAGLPMGGAPFNPLTGGGQQGGGGGMSTLGGMFPPPQP